MGDRKFESISLLRRVYKLSVPRLSRGPSGPRLADELEALARREACGPSPRRLLISFSTPGRSRHLHRR
jgi:hypothetical protein